MPGSRPGWPPRRSTSPTIALLHLAFLLFAGLVRYLVVGPPFALPTPPQWLAVVVGGAIAVVYFASFWAIDGRTVGMQVLGLRLAGRRRDDLRARPGRCCGPSSASPSRPGCCGSSSAGATPPLQDLLVRSTVIYDWSYRPIGAGRDELTA